VVDLSSSFVVALFGSGLADWAEDDLVILVSSFLVATPTPRVALRRGGMAYGGLCRSNEIREVSRV